MVKAVETDQWRSPDVQRYKQLKEKILVFNGLVLRANRINIPTFLRNKAVDLAHQGHQGMVKTKQLIRDKVWFPGIDNLVEEKVKNCLSCQASTVKSSPPEPPLPTAPWSEVKLANHWFIFPYQDVASNYLCVLYCLQRFTYNVTSQEN